MLNLKKTIVILFAQETGAPFNSMGLFTKDGKAKKAWIFGSLHKKLTKTFINTILFV